MSDSTTTDSTKTLMGFDVSAKLSIGDPSSRHTIDISETLTEVNFAFKNFTFLPPLFLRYIVDAKYISSMANPFELELEITEKGMGTTPRSVMSGTFVCVPKNAPVAMIQNSSSDIVRFPRHDSFFPLDLTKTFTAENAVVVSGNVSSAINKAFNASVTGGAKLKLGTIANTTSYSQIVLPRGKLKAHMVQLINQYGLSDLNMIAYSDFTNFYVHSANESLVGDGTSLTMFYGEQTQAEADNATTPEGHFYTKYAPTINTVSGKVQNTFSGDVTAITYPRSGGYSVSTINMKNSAKKMKTTNMTDSFNYFDLYKTTTTEMNMAADNSYPIQNMLTRESTSLYNVTFTIVEPFTLNDFIIGRPVEFDSSVTEYLGLEMSGYIDSVSYTLRANANSRWVGMARVTVKCASNSSVVQ